jgi:DNA adenine methylase
MDPETKIKALSSQNKMNAPFGYFGSKSKIALQLCGDLPPHNCWVEAFCGSAALSLRKKPAPIEIINDIDNEIVNFFKQLRNNHSALKKAVELTPYAETELMDARIEKQDLDELERARRFLIQSMMAINGVFGEAKGGFSYSDSYARSGHDARVNRWLNLPARLDQVVARLKSIRIENKDAVKLMKRYENRPATLIYLDPPYFAERSNGYNIDAKGREFHENLLQMAIKLNCMVFISGYENTLYNEMLTGATGWERKTIDASTKGTTGTTHRRTEVVWMNRHYINALQTKEVPIILTEEERRMGKLNPERKASISYGK